MKEIKFICPACGQHIEASAEWTGRQIDCPGCKRPVTIPPPLKDPMQSTPAVPAAPPATPDKIDAPRLSESNPTEAPPPENPSAPAPKGSVEKQNTEAGSALKTSDSPDAPEHPERPRVAVLTSEVKLDIVRAVRQQIASESSWLPGVIDGTNAYAAKVEGGKTVQVDVGNPEATRFSLMGAFLLEFHRRNVTPTATGRRRLLDQEIVDAIRAVLLGEMNEEEREEAQDSVADVNPMSISHPQCLAVLDVLEERYSQRMEQAQADKARRRLGNTRVGDLVRKLEKKAGVAPEEVATALYNELMDVRGRLDRLEGRLINRK